MNPKVFNCFYIKLKHTKYLQYYDNKFTERP